MYAKIADALPSYMCRSEWTYSNSPSQSAFQLAYNTDLPMFEWLKRHPDELRDFALSVVVCITVFI